MELCCCIWVVISSMWSSTRFPIESMAFSIVSIVVFVVSSEDVPLDILFVWTFSGLFGVEYFLSLVC